MTIDEAQQEVDKWIKTVGVRYFNELTNMAILTEEVGELARLMARKYGDQTSKPADKKSSINDEIADILWVILCMSNQMNINLTEAFKENINKKYSRDKDRYKK